MLRRSDFAVIGAGVMGSATAYWLARTGASVVLVDQFERGHTRGGSHGDARIFRIAYPELDYAQLALESLALWRRLEDELGTPLLTRTGGVDHGAGVFDTIGGALRRLPVAYEVLDPAAAMERWPGMRFADEVLFQPDAGRLHADHAVEAFTSLAESHGATLLFGSRATVARATDAGVIIATDEDEIEADVAVIAAGAWAARLAPSTFDLPPIEVTHEEPAYFVARQSTDGWPIFVHYPNGAARGFAAYGSTVPGGGMKVGLHASGSPIDPDVSNRPRGPEVARRLEQYVASWLPGLDPRPTQTVSCIYDRTPTEDFVIDRRAAVVVATGFSGHGFKFAPAIGRLVAGLALGEDETLPRFRSRTR